MRTLRCRRERQRPQSLKYKRRDPLDRGVHHSPGRAEGTCHARRHWNSPSYRTAAGKTTVGEIDANTKLDGAEGDRTPDLCSAIAALSQLSYSPLGGAGTWGLSTTSGVPDRNGPAIVRGRPSHHKM